MQIKPRRILLFPFVLIYGAIVWLRNKFFDFKIIKSIQFPFPVIIVGNLQAGGTGKTPMVKYIANLLKQEKLLAILSRGYKRKSSGFVFATNSDNASSIGDEPFEYFKLYNNTVSVAVCEKRVAGIEQLQKIKNHDVVICDDAFQHRYLKSEMNIVLTAYNDLYCNDCLLPAGNLREPIWGASRAQIIIVTKCPDDIRIEAQKNIAQQIKIKPPQHLFFTTLIYTTLYNPFTNQSFNQAEAGTYAALLVSGIAKPSRLQKYIGEQFAKTEFLMFADHHEYTINDLATINEKFNTLATENKLLVTTAKDFARLCTMKLPFEKEKLFIQNIEINFLNNEKSKFDTLMQNYVRKN
jgi:tetraacyldisaccharide 4'-kinase